MKQVSSGVGQLGFMHTLLQITFTAETLRQISLPTSWSLKCLSAVRDVLYKNLEITYLFIMYYSATGPTSGLLIEVSAKGELVENI